VLILCLRFRESVWGSVSYPLSPAEPHTDSLKRKQRINTDEPRDLIGVK